MRTRGNERIENGTKKLQWNLEGERRRMRRYREVLEEEEN